MMEEVQPREGERLNRLAAERVVLQRSRGHRSATDDLLAAWLAYTSQPHAGVVLDLGCGHATATLLLSTLLPEASFIGVEAQAISADLARRNLRLNRLDERARIVEGDLRQQRPEDLVPAGTAGFDLITGTPPFMPLGSGVASRDPQRYAARFETRGGIEAYAEAAAALLAPGGRASFLMDAGQDARCQRAVDGAGLALCRMLVFTPREGLKPRFRGYVALRAEEAPPVAPEVEPFCVRDRAGIYTASMKDLRALLQVDGGEDRC